MTDWTTAYKSKAPPWSQRLLLAASLLLPLLVAGLFAWRDYARTMAEAEVAVERAGALAQEHALKVVETATLVLERIGELIEGRDWQQLRSEVRRVHQGLFTLDDRLEHLRALHIIEPDGSLFAISRSWPTPAVNLAGRDYFRRHAAGFTGTFFGEPLIGRTTGTLAFTISRPRLAADGRFDGVLIGSVEPRYFDRLWSGMGTGRGAFALFRDDGQILAQWSAEGGHPILPALLPSTRGGAVRMELQDAQGGAWLANVRRVGQEQIFVAYAMPRHAMLAIWREHAILSALLALPVAVALFALTWYALSRWQHEQTVQQALARNSSELLNQIARREAAEEKLAQAQRLEAMGRLTGGIAHDFNNLLTTILGTVHLLERHIGAAADDKTRRLLNAARDAVGRGAKLNASLLAFARRQPLRREALDVNGLVQGFEPLLQRALGDEVTLRSELGTGLPPCQADAAQLEAALLNLAINARDAMPHGGEVRLVTRTAWLSAADLATNEDAAPGAFAEIMLADSGQGMAPEVLSRAFEPFFTTKPQGKGTGLGLSQVFGFVRQLGGHVAIRSALGVGTAVSLYLPLTVGVAAAPLPLPQTDGSSVVAVASATVLVAEDDAEVREVAAEMLRDAGFRVLAAADGRQALALLERGEQVDVLFSDVVMPGGISGLDLARLARRMRPSIGVLLASGYAAEAVGRDAPEFELLAKPYDRNTVIRLIAEKAQQHRQGAA